MSRPLSGTRILDLTQNLAGPFCTMMLGDLGADVIKVEPPGGDNARSFGPPFLGSESGAFLQVNRNKRSIVVDLKKRDGIDLIREMSRSCDVLVENFRTGVMDRLGLGSDALLAESPQLIFCSVSGFGPGSPFEDRAGLDLIAQAMSGLMKVTGYPDQAPTKIGVPIADLSAGLFACIAVLAALKERDNTGRGHRIDVSLLDAALAMMPWEAGIYFAGGDPPEPTGTAHRLAAPYQLLPSADGFITIGAASQSLWERACVALGAEHLLADERFRTNADRMLNRAVLADVLSDMTRTQSTDHLVDLLNAHGVPASPVLGLDETLEGDHAAAREMAVAAQHPTVGDHRLLGSPMKFDGTSLPVTRPAPLLGQHAVECLLELGFEESRIERLVHDGVISVGGT